MEEKDLCRHCHTPLPDAGPCRKCGRVFIERIAGVAARANDRLWVVVRMARGSVLVCIPMDAWDHEIPVIDLTELT